MRSDTRARVKRFLAGHRASAARQRKLIEDRGPHPEQAVAECLDILAELERKGLWPGPRDPISEREIARVRASWSKIKREFRGGANR